jgi:hypothetical protein
MTKYKFAVGDVVDASPVPDWPQIGVITELRDFGYMVRLDGNWTTRFYKENELEKATEGAILNRIYYKNYYAEGCDCGAVKASYPNPPAGHAFMCSTQQQKPWPKDDDDQFYGF